MATITDYMGLYIHTPFCRQKCSYCDFPSYQGLQEYYNLYDWAILEEMDQWIHKHPESTSIPIDSIYFGGGTPTELSLDQLERIVNGIRKRFTIKNDLELSIEANPGELSFDSIKGLREIGFNRISFGIQTFNEESLALLRRGHTREEALSCTELAKKAGFSNISVDLIYGLPYQTMEDLRTNLDIVESLDIDHVSIYGLQLEGGTLLEKQVELGQVKLPSEEIIENMYDYVINSLEKQMFERYEISNFAKKESYSRHNIKYWQYCDYLGFGVGAHSFYKGMRYRNHHYVVPYLRHIEMGESPIIEKEIISEERAIEDFSFLALRTKWGLRADTFENRFKVSLISIYGTVLQHLMKHQLITFKDNAYVLTPLGIKHGNYVFEQFIRD